MDLADKRVLVLGSGTGHLAREARTRGAALVDGIEPDERLLLIARLLNAYHGATRVSFSTSVTDPRDAYDVVLEP
jgi:predicted RNA methylase